MTRMCLEDLYEEMERGKVYECSLRDPKFHLDGFWEGDSVFIDVRSSVLETLCHELIHRRKPRWGERAVTREARRLLGTMDEATKARWWKAYRRIRKVRRPKVVDDGE